MRVLLRFLIASLILIVVILGNPCSTEKQREMLIRACGHYRRKRGYSYNEEKPSKKNYKKFQNTLQLDEARHKKHYTIIDKDGSGGFIVRHKRENFEVKSQCPTCKSTYISNTVIKTNTKHVSCYGLTILE